MRTSNARWVHFHDTEQARQPVDGGEIGRRLPRCARASASWYFQGPLGHCVATTQVARHRANPSGTLRNPTEIVRSGCTATNPRFLDPLSFRRLSALAPLSVRAARCEALQRTWRLLLPPVRRQPDLCEPGQEYSG